MLVRGERDGFYYRGTVKEETEVSDGCCVVVMGLCRVSGPPAVLTPPECCAAVLISAGA